jgi:hypothetical protein
LCLHSKNVDKAKVKDFVQRVRESRAALQRKVRKRRIPLGSVVQEGQSLNAKVARLFRANGGLAAILPPATGFILDLSQLLPAPKRALRPLPKVATPVTYQQ